MHLLSFYLVFMFLLSFSEAFSVLFSYAYVAFGVVILLFCFNKIVIPLELAIISAAVFIFPVFQYFAVNNYAGKWIFNSACYFVGIVSVITLMSRMREKSLLKMGSYLRRSVFVAISVYVLYPVFEYGVIDIFLVDRNYLYAIANSLLPSDVLVKQKMSALVMLYIVFTWGMIRIRTGLPRLLLLWVLLILALNMLLGSRSQTIGLLIALLLITVGGNGNRIRIYSILVVFSFACALWLMTTDFFVSLSAIDIRVMLFHSAAILFFEYFLTGVGLFFIPQFLEIYNNRFFSEFSFLYPDSLSALTAFPTGFESSFMQFSAELGVISFVFLYFSVWGLLRVYVSTAGWWRYYIFFVIAYFFSSIFEDNLSQPSFYMIISILMGWRAYSRRRLKVVHKSIVNVPLLGNSTRVIG
jgi:hypothetical protein